VLVGNMLGILGGMPACNLQSWTSNGESWCWKSIVNLDFNLINHRTNVILLSLAFHV